MEPLERVADILEKVEGLSPDKVHLYAYTGVEDMQPPIAVVNYVTLRSVTAMGSQMRLAFAVLIQIIATEKKTLSKLIGNVVRAGAANGFVTDIEGGTTRALSTEVEVKGSLKNAILAEVTFVTE